MKFSITLKALIRRNGLTTAELARAIDVSSKTISDWLSGRVPRDLDAIKRCSEFFQVSVHYLLYGEEDRNVLGNLLEKTEIHTGMYEVTVRKVISKDEPKGNG